MNAKQLRFLAVGVLNTLIDFVFFSLFVHLGLMAVVSNYISTSIALIFSYYANKHYTFKASRTTWKHVFAFFIATIIGIWVLQPIVIYLIHPLANNILHSLLLSALAAKIVATGVSLVWNYYMYDRVVFKADQTLKMNNKN